MSTWAIVDNPAWAGKRPSDGPFEPDCHDHSHFITIGDACGANMHVHESQIPTNTIPVGARCPGCGGLMTFAPGVLHQAFAELRKQGWIR